MPIRIPKAVFSVTKALAEEASVEKYKLRPTGVNSVVQAGPATSTAGLANGLGAVGEEELKQASSGKNKALMPPNKKLPLSTKPYSRAQFVAENSVVLSALQSHESREAERGSSPRILSDAARESINAISEQLVLNTKRMPLINTESTEINLDIKVNNDREVDGDTESENSSASVIEFAQVQRDTTSVIHDNIPLNLGKQFTFIVAEETDGELDLTDAPVVGGDACISTAPPPGDEPIYLDVLPNTEEESSHHEQGEQQTSKGLYDTQILKSDSVNNVESENGDAPRTEEENPYLLPDNDVNATETHLYDEVPVEGNQYETIHDQDLPPLSPQYEEVVNVPQKSASSIEPVYGEIIQAQKSGRPSGDSKLPDSLQEIFDSEKFYSKFNIKGAEKEVYTRRVAEKLQSLKNKDGFVHQHFLNIFEQELQAIVNKSKKSSKLSKEMQEVMKVIFSITLSKQKSERLELMTKNKGRIFNPSSILVQTLLENIKMEDLAYPHDLLDAMWVPLPDKGNINYNEFQKKYNKIEKKLVEAMNSGAIKRMTDPALDFYKSPTTDQRVKKETKILHGLFVSLGKEKMTEALTVSDEDVQNEKERMLARLSQRSSIYQNVQDLDGKQLEEIARLFVTAHKISAFIQEYIGPNKLTGIREKFGHV